MSDIAYTIKEHSLLKDSYEVAAEHQGRPVYLVLFAGEEAQRLAQEYVNLMEHPNQAALLTAEGMGWQDRAWAAEKRVAELECQSKEPQELKPCPDCGHFPGEIAAKAARISIRILDAPTPAAASEGQEKDAKAGLREFMPDPTEWMNTIRGLLFTLGMREEMSNWSGHFDGWGAAFEWIKYHVKRSQGLAKTEATGKAEGVELPQLERDFVHTRAADPFIREIAKALSLKTEAVEKHVRVDDDSLRCMYAQHLVLMLARIDALESRISSLQRELEEARKGDQVRREKMMDVMHTLSVIREGSAHNVWASANACWEVLNSVLPSPPEPAKEEAI